MLGIWLVLRLFAGGLDPSDTIVIPAVSHQSAWHLGGQVEKGGTGGKASERGGRGESKGAGRERFLRRESWKSFCMRQHVCEISENQFACLGSRRLVWLSGKLLGVILDVCELPGDHFTCLRSYWESCWLSEKLLGIVLAIWETRGSVFGRVESSWDSF